MLNLFKSDLFRMVRRGDFWFFTLMAVVLPLVGTILLAYVSSPEFTMMVNDNMMQQADELTEEQLADLQASMEAPQSLNDREIESVSESWNDTFASGGLLGLLGSAFAVLFLVRDFKSGFIKNLPMDRRGRLRYFGEKLVVVALVQALFLGLLAASTTLSFAAFGFTYKVAETVGDLALWLLLTWFVTCAYAFLAACVAWLTRSEWAGVGFAILVSSGVMGAIVIQLMLMLGQAYPVLTQVPFWTLRGAATIVGEGASGLLTANAAYPIPGLLPAGAVALTCAIYIAVSMVVVFAVCRRRDIR